MNELALVPQLARANTIHNRVLEFVSVAYLNSTSSWKYRCGLDLEFFVAFLNGRELTPKLINEFAIHCHSRKWTPDYIAKKLSTLKRFFRWCFQMGYTESRWYEFVPTVHVPPPGNPKIIRHEEYLRLRKACCDIEQEWCVVCGYNTGLRLKDVCMVEWNQIDRERQILTARPFKTRHKTNVTVEIPYASGGDLHQIITTLWQQKDDMVRVLDGDHVSPLAALRHRGQPNTQAVNMKGVFERAKVVGRSFKDFRSTFESRMANSGINIGLAAKITGRTDTKTLLRYILPDTEAAREGIAKAMEIHHKLSTFA